MTNLIRERVLLMGPPGSGKSYQLLQIYQALEELGVKMHLIDMEDKIPATLTSLGVAQPPGLSVCLCWEDFAQTAEELRPVPGEWIGIDRIDLTWPMVQRWYTQQKYGQELAQRLLERDKQLAKRAKFIPRFEEGSWQTINENYDSTFHKLVYASRCNLVMTCGIQDIREDQFDMFGLGVSPRGQKELGHQPHTVLLLTQRYSNAKEPVWQVTTAKDLPNRTIFYRERIYDLYSQYLANYYSPVVKVQ